MGLFDWLFRRLRVKSITNQSITPSQNDKSQLPTAEYPSSGYTELSLSSPSMIALEKESLQLGVAAGYTGRAIKDIESSLNRIESLMVTKDWFTIKLDEALKEYEIKEESRFQAIEATLSSLVRYFGKLPAETRLETIREAVNEFRLTNKMQQLVHAVQEVKEISYEDLAPKLNISQDALRGLLSKVVRRTGNLQRFERDNKGWVRFNELNQTESQINQKDADNTVKEGISSQ